MTAIDADGLDPAQQAAVASTADALLVLAGPGSGKTRVLTHRIARRVADETMEARHAVAVTFTRRAAYELRSRLRTLGVRDIGPVGTFHSIALAQIRQHDLDSGRAERKILPSRAVLSSELSEHLRNRFGARPPVTVSVALREIDWAKANGLSVSDYRHEAPRSRSGRLGPSGTEAAAELFKHFESLKSRKRLLDFDDLLAECVRLMNNDEHFGAAQRWLHRHFFVDEFQDLNRLQWDLLLSWLGGRAAVEDGVADLCAVGDANQAIYGWNGADSSYIRNFGQMFAGTETVRLDLNYRSHASIVAASRAIIGAAQDRAPKGTTEVQRSPGGEQPNDNSAANNGGSRTARPLLSGPAPTATGYDDESAEASGIAQWIIQRRGRGNWASFGVLARTNAQLELIAETFDARGIPNQVSGRRAELLTQPAVRELLQRFTVAGTGFEALVADLKSESVADQQQVVPPASTRAGGDRANDLHANSEPLDRAQLRLLELAAAYLDEQENTVGHGRHSRRSTGEGFASWITLLSHRDREFTAEVVGFDRRYATSQHHSRQHHSRQHHSQARYEGDVTLATFHSAKGLQWPHVVVAGVEHGLVPLRENDPEERRLFYVAVSRAARTLHFTWARSRASARSGAVDRQPSPWLALIEHASAEPPPLEASDAKTRLAAARAALRAGHSD